MCWCTGVTEAVRTFTGVTAAVRTCTGVTEAMCAGVQVSQYTFAMCSYRERKADPTEMLQLDGFTVDYCEPLDGL